MRNNSNKIKNKKLVFIDTDVFYNTITSNAGKATLDALKSKLTKGEFALLLPDVIKAEIIEQFEKWKSNLIEKVTDNLTTKKILGILDEGENTENKKRQTVNTKNKLLNEELIDNLIKSDKDKLISTIETFYNTLFQEIDSIFNNINTINIPLTNEIIMNGIKRSLLKKAPYTNKYTETTYTKDVDCIAFESVLSYINSDKVTEKNSLTFCVLDKDYVENTVLRSEITTAVNKIKNIDTLNNLSALLNLDLPESKTSIINFNAENQVQASLATPSEELTPKIDSSSKI